MIDKTNSVLAATRRSFLAGCIALGLGAGGVVPALAQSNADNFFAGKTISIYVGFGPGGGYDVYARLVSEFLGRHIPGIPTSSSKTCRVPAGGLRCSIFTRLRRKMARP